MRTVKCEPISTTAKPFMAAESVSQPPLLAVKVEPGYVVVPPETAPAGAAQQDTPIPDNPPTEICEKLPNHVVDVSTSVSQLCSLSAALSDFQRCYDDLQRHINFIRTFIDTQLHKTLDPECQRLNSEPSPPQPLAIAASDGTQLQKPKETPINDPGLAEFESVCESQPLAIASSNETQLKEPIETKIASDGTQLQKPKETTVAEPGLAEFESVRALAIVSSDETQLNEPTETKIVRPALSEIESLCRSSNGRGLRKYVVTHFSDIPKLRTEIPAAMKLSSKPGRLVLCSVGKIFRQSRKALTGDNQTVKEVQGIVLILESFLLMEGDGDGNKIPGRVKKEAWLAVIEWVKRLEAEGGVANAVEVDARALLLFICCFEVTSSVKNQDIISLIQRSNAMEICGALRHSGSLLAKIPELIGWMTKRNMEPEAVNIVLIFGVEDKFPPQAILTSFLQRTNETWVQSRAAAQGSVKAVIEANKKKLADLKRVLECLEKHKLDPDKALPEWKINENISSLEESIPDDGEILEEQVEPKPKADETQTQTPKGGLTTPMTSNGPQLLTTSTHAVGNSNQGGLMITSSLADEVSVQVNGIVIQLPSPSYAVENSYQANMIRTNSVNCEIPPHMNSFPASSSLAAAPFPRTGAAGVLAAGAGPGSGSPAGSGKTINNDSHQINETISSLEKGTPDIGKTLEEQQQAGPTKRKAEEAKFSEKLKQTRVVAGDATQTTNSGPIAPMTSTGRQLPTTPAHTIGNSIRDGHMNGNVRPLPSTSYAVESSYGANMIRTNSANGESPLHTNRFHASSSAAPFPRTGAGIGAGSPAGSYAAGFHSGPGAHAAGVGAGPPSRSYAAGFHSGAGGVHAAGIGGGPPAGSYAAGFHSGPGMHAAGTGTGPPAGSYAVGFHSGPGVHAAGTGAGSSAAGFHSGPSVHGPPAGSCAAGFCSGPSVHGPPAGSYAAGFHSGPGVHAAGTGTNSPAGSYAAGFHSAMVDRTGQIINSDSHQYRGWHGEAAAREERSANRVYPEPSEALGLNGLSGASKPASSLASFPGLLNSERKSSDLYQFADAVL